jgi:RimJ/RimL family protein N-acetyltransferase
MHRQASIADLDAVYAIYMEKDAIPYLGFDPMPRAAFQRVMDELVASESFFVVEIEGCVQGFYRATRQEGRAGHVASLGTFAIAPESRGTGLAKSILEEAILRLHHEGVTRIELTVEADNPRAIRFYGNLGFELEGTLRSAYKRSSDVHYVDELFMAKLLPPLANRNDA